MDAHAISFGPFRLLAAERLLLEGDKPVRLGGRAFDILAALVERAGQVVGKGALIARAWPEACVEESNLKLQVSALRRALGDGQGGHRYVVTVPGRGYNFVAPVSLEQPPRAQLPPTIAPAGVHNLPIAVTRTIGRDETVTALVSRLSRQRLVTIVGPGGIGKTTVALAVAERMIESYEHGVWLVDLAPLADPHLVPSAVATMLGLEIRTDNALPGLIAALRDRRMLLLLDNCEHMIDAAASLAAAVLSGTPGVNILATSREPLGVASEREHRLGPLGSPPTSSGLTAAEAAAFPAVQLFVERITAIVEDFALTDANAPAVIEICRRLDGLPLAIEFAAPRVEVLGVESLAARLDHSLPLLGTRRRATAARHHTMRAVVDWSYRLLSEDEQVFLRALGIFAGGFTVEAAAAVALGPTITHIDALNRLADLVAKSLVVADVSGANPRFRLLDTIRAFTLEKLDESSERELIKSSHAEYYRRLFERAEGEAAVRSTHEWLADYGWQIDNLRAALDWAFSPSGDASIGVTLAAAAAPLWMHLSLVDECRSRAKQALEALGENREDRRGEMRAHTALAASLMFITGAGVPEVGAAWAKAFELAEELADTEFQLLSLCGLWAFHVNSGRQRMALQVAQRFCIPPISSSRPFAKLLGERMLGVSEHHLGDQPSARRWLEGVLATPVTSITSDYRRVVRFQIAPEVMARVFLARTLWLQGDADQAARLALSGVEEARAANHANSLGYILSLGACLIALWRGDLDMADGYVRMLLDQSTRYGLSFWLAFGRCYQGQLVIRRGDVTTGLQLLRTGVGEFIESNTTSRFIAAQMAEALRQAGRIGEGLAVIEGAIRRSKTDEELWATAELLRVKGELVRMQAIPEASAAAEDQFRHALELSRHQGALSWELRAATSLARLWYEQSRPAEALALLQPVYDRFTEGFGATDLIAAKQLLDALDSAGSD